jgi:hypothetical protein
MRWIVTIRATIAKRHEAASPARTNSDQVFRQIKTMTTPGVSGQTGQTTMSWMRAEPACSGRSGGVETILRLARAAVDALDRGRDTRLAIRRRFDGALRRAETGEAAAITIMFERDDRN